MPAATLFISYRRDDAAGFARALCEALSREFGAERVFIDVDDIPAGQAFDEVILQALGQARVVLVLIGPRWAGERTGQPPRLADADDTVRREVATALALGLQVLPLLLDGAAMPTAAQLPDDLRPLAKRNALALGNARFADDITRLLSVLRPALGEAGDGAGHLPMDAPSASAARHTGTRLALAGATALALALAGWLLWQRPALHPPGPDARPTAPSAARAASAAALPASPANTTATTTAAGASHATARPAINGAWQAEITYDWPNAHYTERFEFVGEGNALLGSASFLRVPRGISDGRLSADGVQFVTRTTEISGGSGESSPTLHRYIGRLVDGELHFVMQTEGSITPHVPVAFTARRMPAAPNR